jgi:phenylacetate-coenzyme A ligase PaaK-like adenylate-forming protein
VVYPLKELPLRRSTLRTLAELQATERLPRPQLEELRARRLGLLVRHACEHVPYYRDLFREQGVEPQDVRQPSDLSRLPVLRKEIARARAADLVADARPKGFLQPLYTSGSTGEPLAVLADSRELSYHLANQLRGKSWHGIEIGDAELRVWHDPRAYVRPTLRSRAFWTASALKDQLLNIRTVSATDLSEQELDRWTEVLRRIRPVSIYGYAASIYFFAQYLLERRPPDLPVVPTVILAAEKIQPHQKRVVAEAFGARVVEEYGSADCGVMAFECEHGRLHTSDESVVLEVCGAGPDGTGELLVTSLTNYAMPLIRYSLGDVVALSDETCPCGRSLGLMRDVVGRTTDFLVDARGEAVHPFRLMLFLQRIEPVTRYRVVQTAVGEVEFVAQTTRDLTSQEVVSVDQAFREALGPETAVAVRTVGSLPLGARGKHRFLESRVPETHRREAGREPGAAAE